MMISTMKRKPLSILLALCVMLSLAACSSGGGSGKAAQEPSSPGSVQNETTPVGTDPEETKPSGVPEFTGTVDLSQAVTPSEEDFLYYDYNSYVEIYGYQGNDNVIVIPNTLADKPVTCTWIEFAAGTDVHGIVIDEGLEKLIRFGTEDGEPHLEAIRIPSTITDASSDNPYSGLPRLQTIEVAEGNERYMAEDGVLYDIYSDSRKLICYPAARPGETFVQPDDSYTSDYAFFGTVNLKRLENAYTGGYNPFAGSSIEEVIFSDRQLSLSGGEFTDAENLRSITMSVNLSSHSGNSAMFKRNSSLEEIIVPEGNPKYFTDDGVLYFISDSGIQYLLYYPTARPGEEYTLAPGTQGIYNVDYAFDNPLYLKVLHSGGAELGSLTLDGIEYKEP